MPLVFPSASVGQTYQSGSSATYQWDGIKWITITPTTQIFATARSSSFATTASFAISATSATSATTAGTASWALNVVSGVGSTPVWSAGGIGIAGTTTNPVISGATRAAHNFRRIGPKEVEFVFSLDYTGVGGSNGNGDYLITIPGGFSIDTTLPNQLAYTGGIGANDNNFWKYAVQGGVGVWSLPTGAAGWAVQPVVYDANRIRIMILNFGSFIRCWGSNALGVASGINIQARYSFQVL